jgi:hypothetical protein
MKMITSSNNFKDFKYRNLALQVWGEVSKTETIKYAHESCGTQTRERQHWQCPATTENYRFDF